MNQPKISILKRTATATIGLIFFGLGLYLVIQSNLGASPWDVLTIGLADRLHTLYGNISIGIGVLLILIDVFVLKEKIGIGTIIDAIIIGKTVDFLNWIDLIPLMTGSIWGRIGVMLLGFLVEGFAQYLYMKMALGYGPKDSLQIGLGRILHRIPIGIVSTIIQATVLVIGVLLGGPFGIGSLIAPFGLGLTQQFAFTIMKFDPKSIRNQGLSETARILFSKG